MRGLLLGIGYNFVTNREKKCTKAHQSTQKTEQNNKEQNSTPKSTKKQKAAKTVYTHPNAKNRTKMPHRAPLLEKALPLIIQNLHFV
jgi:hypothetical protein